MSLKAAFTTLLAALLWVSAAAAQSVTSVGASWTSLGYGPLMLSAPGATAGAVQFAVSDTQPAAAGGAPIPPGYGVAVASSHRIWAIAPGASSPISVTASPYPGAIGATEGAAAASAATPSAASSLVLKAGAGALTSLVCTPTANGYLMLFDATSPPADGAVAPKWVAPVYAYAGGSWSWANPLSFSTGIVAVFSSTGPFTKTAAANAFIGGQAQ